MAKTYFTREEIIARDLARKNAKVDVQEIPEKFIKTHNGYRIKVETFTKSEILEPGISYSPEVREMQDKAVERIKNKPIVLRENERN